MTAVKYPDVSVELVGQDGNAFSILGRVEGALKRAGYGDGAKQFMTDATAGDYDHLLRTVMEYVSVGDGDDDYDDDEDF